MYKYIAITLTILALGVVLAQEDTLTLKLAVERADPTGASFDVPSGATFTVILRIENNNTGKDADRTMCGPYALTFSPQLTKTGGDPSTGTFDYLAKGSPLYRTFTFQAPTGPLPGLNITLSAGNVTCIHPHRDFPVPGDIIYDSKSYTVNVLPPPDNQPPVGSIMINNNAPYTNNTNVTLHLDATDNVGVTGYRLDGGSWVDVPSTPHFIADVPWTLPGGDGGKTVTVEYKDAIPNFSLVYTDDITLDQTPPTLEWGSPSGTSGLNGWWTSAVSLPYTTADNLSGVASSVPGSPLSFDSEGVGLTQTVTVMDNAGNPATFTSPPFNIDWTAPVVTITAPVNGSYYQNAPALAYNVVEANPYTTVELGWSNDEGVHTATVTATDAAGNVGSASVTYTVDRTPPVVTITAPVNGSYYQNAPALAYNVVEINPYTTAEVGWSNAEGVHTATVTATDAAGNVGSASVTYTVDRTPPVITINCPTAGATYILNEPVFANWSVWDAISGVASSSGTVPSGSAISTSPVGPKSFTVTATDNAGNSASQTVSYMVGYNLPATLLPPYQGPPATFKNNRSIPLKWQYRDFYGVIVNSSSAHTPGPGFPGTIAFVTPGGGETPIIVDDPGASGLTYDATTNTWHFNWKTTKTMIGTYRIVITTGQTGQTSGPFDIILVK